MEREVERMRVERERALEKREGRVKIEKEELKEVGITSREATNTEQACLGIQRRAALVLLFLTSLLPILKLFLTS